MLLLFVSLSLHPFQLSAWLFAILSCELAIKFGESIKCTRYLYFIEQLLGDYLRNKRDLSNKIL